MLVKLESAHNALTSNHNFNLAEVLIGEYFETIPQEMIDEKLTKSFLDALRDRNFELFLSVVDAEIERLRSEKVKLLWTRIVGKAQC